jgi:hypothetical protein
MPADEKHFSVGGKGGGGGISVICPLPVGDIGEGSLLITLTFRRFCLPARISLLKTLSLAADATSFKLEGRGLNTVVISSCVLEDEW